MLENVVVAIVVLLACVFLARRIVKTYRRGGCCELQESGGCSCCSECWACDKEKAEKNKARPFKTASNSSDPLKNDLDEKK